jgi:undecaprenyl-phosphate 4-deoxy-4-formamido-L-arabinose transferase
MRHVAPPPPLARGLSIVIPVYNSALILPDLVARLAPVLEATGHAYEVILVDDGSRDDSWATITRLTAAHSWVRGIGMMRNYGQHNALLAGMRDARFDVTMTMDDDLQHPPEELPTLLAALNDDVDVVYAPPAKEQHGVLRNLASVITKLALQSTMGARTARMASAWRVFRTHLREASSGFHGPFVSVDVLLTWGTTRFAAVPLRHDSRARGASNYTLLGLVRHALNMMTGFSVLPLQLASVMGFAFTIFGALVLFFVLGRYLWQGTTVAGFPFLASIVAIFSGAQLFALGIMGEYLARMHFRSMDKPSYTVKTRTGSPR